MTTNLKCLICYCSFPAIISPPGSHSYEERAKLFQLFRRYFNVDVETCEEPFCYSCTTAIGSLFELNSQIQVLSRLASRITAKCTVKIIESVRGNRDNENFAEDDDGNTSNTEVVMERPIDEIRRCILNRYNVKVGLRRVDNCEPPETSGSVIHEDHHDSFLGFDPDDADDDADDDDYVPSDDERTSSRENVSSSKPEAHVGESSNDIIGSSEIETSANHERQERSNPCVEIAPGKFVYKKQYPFRRLGKEFQCESCARMYHNMAQILSHVRNHARGRVRQCDPTRFSCPLAPVGPDKYLYANKYPICRIAGKFRCPFCKVARASRYKLVAHLRLKHILAQNDKGATAEADKNGNCSGIESNAPSSSSKIKVEIESGTGVPGSSSAVQSTGPLEGHGEFELTDPYENGFADPSFPVQGALPDETIEKIMNTKEPSKAVEEVGPGKYAYHKEFEFAKVGDVYECLTCHRKKPSRRLMTSHVKNSHYDRRSNPPTRSHFEWKELEPNKFSYGPDYIVEKVNGRFQCPVCKHTTKLKYKLAEHIRSNHIRKQEGCVCDECGKSFMKSAALRSHKQRVHEKQMMACSICERPFTSSILLERHERTHAGGLRFFNSKICKYCGQGFPSTQQLLSHASKHNGEKHFTCPHCAQSFHTYDKMYHHRKTCKDSDTHKTEACDVDQPAPSDPSSSTGSVQIVLAPHNSDMTDFIIVENILADLS